MRYPPIFDFLTTFMKLKRSLFAIFLFSASGLFAQNASTNPFDKFANNQSGLIQKAYDKRDSIKQRDVNRDIERGG